MDKRRQQRDLSDLDIYNDNDNDNDNAKDIDIDLDSDRGKENDNDNDNDNDDVAAWGKFADSRSVHGTPVTSRSLHERMWMR